MLPNASDLKNFLEVSACGNITQASRRLGMTQPALSQSIQKLERGLGVPLLIRSKAGVSLTRAGKRVETKARELLGTWEEVEKAALDEENEIQGRFAIGCHPSVAKYTVSFFLPSLLAKHPRLRFELTHDLSRNVVNLVIDRKIDIAIAVNPLRHPDLVITPMLSDSFGLWHAGKSRKSEALLCDPKLSQVNWLLRKLEKQGFKPSQVVPCDNLEVIASLAARGAGYALLPERVAVLTGNLVKADRRFASYKDEICLVYRADSMRSRAGKSLIAEIRDCALK